MTVSAAVRSRKAAIAAGKEARPGSGRASRRRSGGRRVPRRSAIPYAFLAPGFILFVALIIYPMIRAFQMSFYDWRIVAGATSDFIGWQNYVTAFHDRIFWRSLANSGAYMLFTVPPQIALGLFVASLLRAKAPGQGLYRLLFYIPVVTSWVVVSLLFQYLFADAGLVNYVLHGVHATNGHTSWLSGRWTAMVAISALGVWKGIGWSMMIFLAALQGVPRDLEEAAAVDGAGDLAGVDIRHRHARDRRLQRVYVRSIDDRRRSGRPDAGVADIHVRAGLQIPPIRVRIGNRGTAHRARVRSVGHSAADFP